MRAQAITVGIIVILSAGVAYLQFSPLETPVPPSIPAVCTCQELRPGMRRIGEQLGFQFDIPLRDFTISEGCSDAPPLICGVDIRQPKASTARLSISWGEEIDDMRPPYPNPILDPLYEDKVEKRRVLDDKREPIGEDAWGYWGQGERWRRVRLLGWVNARYGSKNEKDLPSYGTVREQDAVLFDRIINSACRLSPPAK
jgi:hypothetical protein